jgi:hypothetical protein
MVVSIKIAVSLILWGLLMACFEALESEEPVVLTRREIPDQVPVLMVHGFHGKAENFDVMRDHFITVGWDEDLLFPIDLSHRKSGKVGINIAHAEEIRHRVDEILGNTGHPKLNIIAHSMGVPASMYYIKVLGGKEKIKKYINLDGGIKPNRGLLAWLMPDTRAGTPLMKALNTPDESPRGMLPDTAYPENHEPGEIGYKAIGKKNARNVFDGEASSSYPDVGHIAFLTDKRVFMEILDFFTE